MDVLKTIPYMILVLGVATLVAGAMALSLSQLGETITKCEGDTETVWNVSQNLCVNSSNSSQGLGNQTDEWSVLRAGQDSNITVAEQLSTVAIIGIMAVIIGLLSSVFVYMAYFRQ